MYNVRERVINIIKQVMQDETDVQEFFETNDKILDLGISSLQFIQMIVYIEQEFDIEFDDEINLESFYDFNNLTTYIVEKLQGIK